MQTEQPSLQSSKKFMIVAGIALILLIIAGWMMLSSQSATPSTDGSDTNTTSTNVYRNETYQFEMTFPEGWTQEPGVNAQILRQAVSGPHSISVAVQEFPEPFRNLNIQIQDIISEEIYFNGIQQSYPGAVLLGSGFTQINDKDAFFIEYTAPHTIDTDVLIHLKQWQIIHNDAAYIVTTGGPYNEYVDVLHLFVQSVQSLTFDVQ